MILCFCITPSTANGLTKPQKETFRNQDKYFERKHDLQSLTEGRILFEINTQRCGSWFGKAMIRFMGKGEIREGRKKEFDLL